MVQHPWTDGVGQQLGADRLASALGVLEELVTLLEKDGAAGDPPVT